MKFRWTEQGVGANVAAVVDYNFDPHHSSDSISIGIVFIQQITAATSLAEETMPPEEARGSMLDHLSRSKTEGSCYLIGFVLSEQTALPSSVLR